MKTLIISSCVGLPIPATKGGAVATLIESLVCENEAENKMDLYILSIYDEEAEEKSKNYQRSHFIFIKYPDLVDKLDSMLDFLGKSISKKYHEHQYIKKLCAIRRIKTYLLENDFDAIVFQNAGFLLNILKDKRIVKKYQDKLYYHVHNDIPKNIYIEGLKQCKCILISQYLLKKINAVCGKNMSDNSLVVKNGINTDLFKNKLTESEVIGLKDSLGIKQDKKIIMFVGRIAKEKGILELTEAMKKIQHTNAVLLIIGSHNFGANQVSSFQKVMSDKFKKMGKKVIFTGYIPNSELWKYYSISDIAVLPSMWEEPAGLTMIEACAAELPLITTNSGGIPEYISSENSIILDKDKDIIEDLSKNIDMVLDNLDTWEERAKEAAKIIREKYNNHTFYYNFVAALCEED